MRLLKYLAIPLICLALSAIGANEAAPKKANAKSKAKSVQRNPNQAPPSWCRARPWPHSRDLNIQEIIEKLEVTERLETLQMIWYEITQRPDKTIGPPLIAYLSKTESNREVRAYIGAQIYFGYDLMSFEPLIKEWPKRPAYAKTEVELVKLCELFHKAGGDQLIPRSPSSKTKTKRGTK